MLIVSVCWKVDIGTLGSKKQELKTSLPDAGDVSLAAYDDDGVDDHYVDYSYYHCMRVIS